MPPSSSASPLRWLFFARLGCAVLAACAGYAALVLHGATWADARQLNDIFPFYHWQIRAFTAAEFRRAAQVLALLAAGGAAGWLLLTASRVHRRERATDASQPGWGAVVLAPLRDLRPAQRRAAAATLAALTGLRLLLSWPALVPLYDDAASYALFVSRGLLAVSAYYPLPNNHVLSNTLSWLFFQVHPGFWWTMRLPVVLTATAATVLLFGGLLREQVRFRPALLATTLFSLSQLSLYHAAVGRGYWLLTGLAGLVFFSTLVLGRSGGQSRRGWWGLVGGGILGAYAVPTFALVLGSAFSWLGLGSLRRRDAAGLARLALAAGLVAAGALLLYAPLLFVSGPAQLFHNGFVAPLPLGAFLAGLPRYAWETEGVLAGQTAAGGALVLVGLGAVGGLLWWARRRGQPAVLGAAWSRLGPAALWFMALPYAVLLTQRVLAPSRTIFYKAFFFFTLLALVLDWLLQRPRAGLQRVLRPLLAGVALAWLTYQLSSLWRDGRAPRQHNAAYHAAFAWLAEQPPGLVLVPEPTHDIFLGVYFRSERPDRPWQSHAEPRPGAAYAYVVAFPNRRGYFQPRFPYPPAFRNPDVEIYRVNTPPDSTGHPAYWHLQ